LEKAGRMVLPTAQVQLLQHLITAIQERTGPDDRVFDFTNQAGLLFFADRRPATRYFHICYAVTKPLQEEVVAVLEQRRPLAILKAGSWTEAFDGVPQSQRTPLVAEFLTNHYDSVAVTNTHYALGAIKPE
jgi:hypothetical protein